MGVQKVNGVDLAQLEGRLDEKFGSIRGQVTRLQGTIDSLEGAWKGIGAGAFNAKQAEINNDMRELGNLLTFFQEAIKTTRTLSGNTEDEVAQAMRGVDVVGGYSNGSAASSSALNQY
jgi:WXG100 family type VII secretion target